MKHYLELVPISARIHHKQNRLSVFCISLAVFLVTTIFGMADMFIRSQIMQARIDGGNFHIVIKDITDEEAWLISKRPDINAAARYGVINFRGDEGYTFDGKPAIIVGCDEAYMTSLMVDGIDEGHFPSNQQQVMVGRKAKEYLGLQIGDDIVINGPDDTKLHYSISGFSKEAIRTMGEDAYGFYVTTAAFREIYPAEKGEQLSAFNSILCVQFSRWSNIQSEIKHLKAQCHLSDEQVTENPKLLGLLGQSSESFMLQVYIAAGILFVLVLFAGIIMISNSLNSNVIQRIEFFGLMRCLGATPKQIKRFVGKEARRWCYFAIPAGVGLGVILIWGLCAVLRMLSPQYFGALPVLSISMPGILAGSSSACLTVVLAAHAPARTAAQVSPLAALSGNVIKLSPVRKAITTKWLRVETSLGIYHAVSNKKKFVFMMLSFSVSIVLFLCFSLVISFTNHTLTPLRPWSADLSIISPNHTLSIERTILKKLVAAPGVKAAYGRMFAYEVPTTIEGHTYNFDIISYDEKQFQWAKAYILHGSIQDVQRELDTGLMVYRPGHQLKLGDTVHCSMDGKDIKIKISGLLSDSPFNTTSHGVLICSEDTFRHISGQNKYTIIDVQLEKDASDAEVNALHQMVGNRFSFSDERGRNGSARGVYYCMWLFLYGFLAVIALITICNLVSSIAWSVEARIAQYGVLRAIGLSSRQLRKMVMAEAVTYTAAGSIFGSMAGLFFHKVLFAMMISNHWGDTWRIPWGELGVIVWIMICSMIAAVHRPVKKLREISIVENLNAQ